MSFRGFQGSKATGEVGWGGGWLRVLRKGGLEAPCRAKDIPAPLVRRLRLGTLGAKMKAVVRRVHGRHREKGKWMTAYVENC